MFLKNENTRSGNIRVVIVVDGMFAPYTSRNQGVKHDSKHMSTILFLKVFKIEFQNSKKR